jgi:PAS domain S-box-containing protein
MVNAAEITWDGDHVIAASMDAMAVIDDDTHVTVNQPYADLYGYSCPDVLTGESWSSLIATGEQQSIEERVLPVLRREGQWRGVVTGRRRDGGTFPHELTLSRLDDGQYLCICRERHRDGRSVNDMDRRDRLIERAFDAVDDIVLIFGEDGELCHWNAKLREATGYTDAEIEAMDPRDLAAPERRDSVPGVIGDLDGPGDRRIDIVTSDGERIPHELRGTTFDDADTDRTYRCGIARERSARERERTHYETIIETVDDGIYALDEDLQFSFVNESLCELVERSTDDLIGTPVTELFEYDAEVATADAVRERVVEGDTAIGTVQASVTTSAGERVLEARYRLCPDSDERYRGSIGVVRDVTDREERELELRVARQFNEELVENAPFGMFRLDEDLRITYENPRAEEILGLPDDVESSAAIGEDIRELPSIVETDQADRFSRLEDGETIEFEFPSESIYGEEAYFTGRGVPLYRDGEFDGAVLMANDISDRMRHERDLKRQRDELETLDRISELLLEITRDLYESPSRTEIEQSVCDRLAESDLYQFAWIGEPDADGHRIVPRASAGIDDGYVESITVTTAEADTSQGPGGRALRTGTVQVSQDIRSDPSFEPWREQALERGIRSAAAVPLVHDDTTYGILAVYAARPLAFSSREQEGLETLGEAIGYAINAIEHRKLLFADTIVELEFTITDPGLVFVRLSERFECELTITGYVESTTGDWSVYLTVDGVSPDAVRDAAVDDTDVADVRIIADEGDTGLMEFIIDGSALQEFTEVGAILTSGSVDEGRGRFCVETPRATDTRQLATRLQTAYPDLTLLAQREFDRPARKAVELRQSIEKRLTDRQQEALTRAYYAGYFEWPRQSTAGDIAESMGIAETTYHYHLRNALDTLVAAFTELTEG